MTSNDERAAVLVRALEACVAGDSSVIGELYKENVRGWAPNLCVSSAAELAVELEDRDEAFTDVEVDLRPLDVGGDRACVEWALKLTHTGPLATDHDVVVEATGIRLTLHGVTVAEFDGGRIRSFRQYWDETELLEQLALLPSG
jgi:ketosteroid isomerase-like protein